MTGTGKRAGMPLALVSAAARPKARRVSKHRRRRIADLPLSVISGRNVRKGRRVIRVARQAGSVLSAATLILEVLSEVGSVTRSGDDQPEQDGG